MRARAAVIVVGCWLGACTTESRDAETSAQTNQALAASGGTGQTASAVTVPTTAAASAPAAFDNPVSNTGAFVQSIAFEFPKGPNGIVPTLGISYSQHGGVGLAGVGWDMPVASIRLDHTEQQRPLSLDDGLAELAVGTRVQRYVAPLGSIAVKATGGVASANTPLLFDPHNDLRTNGLGFTAVGPMRDFSGFLVQSKDGRNYEFGGTDSTGRMLGVWPLKSVSDIYNNEIRYQYATHGPDANKPELLLKSIEYGSGAWGGYVVVLDYVASPWERFSYTPEFEQSIGKPAYSARYASGLELRLTHAPVRSRRATF